MANTVRGAAKTRKGPTLAQAIDDLGWTATDLASKASLGITTVYRAINGEGATRRATVRLIATALGKSIEETRALIERSRRAEVA